MLLLEHLWLFSLISMVVELAWRDIRNGTMLEGPGKGDKRPELEYGYCAKWPDPPSCPDPGSLRDRDDDGGPLAIRTRKGQWNAGRRRILQCCCLWFRYQTWTIAFGDHIDNWYAFGKYVYPVSLKKQSSRPWWKMAAVLALFRWWGRALVGQLQTSGALMNHIQLKIVSELWVEGYNSGCEY